MQEIHLVAKRAAEAGTPLNWLVTIYSHEVALKADDAAHKRWLCNKSKNVWQAVRGRNKTAPRQSRTPCITVYEKRANSVPHAHMLLHAARGNDAILKRLCDMVVVHARPASPTDIGYITKQRLPGSPEFEATTTHRRQAGARIAGARYSFNADAKALLAGEVKAAPAASAVAPVAVTETPVQLFLPLIAPAIDIRAAVERKRIERGLTQAEIGAVIGYRQPGYCNTIVRRHDPLSGWARNRAIEWLAAA